MLQVLLRRFGRDAAGLVLSAALALYAENPWFIAAKPLLAMAGKYLREKGVNYVPF